MISTQIRVHVTYTLHLVLLLAIYPILWTITLIKSIWTLGQKCDDINGQVAVVTGSAQGLGRELAIELAKRGCHIALVDVQYNLAKTTATSISELYKVKTKAYKVDISNYEQLVEFHSQVIEDFGDVTILMNNAGLILVSDSNFTDVNVIQNVINVNFTSHILINQLFLPRMKAVNRGYIVATCSLGALFPLPILQVYAPTKSAVRSYMSSLRTELKSEKFKIHLTTVMPTFLTTHQQSKDFVNSTMLGQLYPLMEGKVVARKVVEGMLQGIEELAIPRVFSIIFKLLELLPTFLRDVVWAIGRPKLNYNNNYVYSNTKSD